MPAEPREAVFRSDVTAELIKHAAADADVIWAARVSTARDLAGDTRGDRSAFPSYPQREIEMVAQQMEAQWAQLMPITHDAFERNGRVCP